MAKKRTTKTKTEEPVVENQLQEVPVENKETPTPVEDVIILRNIASGQTWDNFTARTRRALMAGNPGKYEEIKLSDLEDPDKYQELTEEEAAKIEAEEEAEAKDSK